MNLRKKEFREPEGMVPAPAPMVVVRPCASSSAAEGMLVSVIEAGSIWGSITRARDMYALPLSFRPTAWYCLPASQ